MVWRTVAQAYRTPTTSLFTVNFQLTSRVFTEDSYRAMNLNLSASVNVFKLLLKPGICLPHHTISTFNDLPIPLGKGLLRDGRTVNIKAVVLDKDDCFAYPGSKEVYEPYKVGSLNLCLTSTDLA